MITQSIASVIGRSILQVRNITKRRLQGAGYTLHIPRLTIYAGERIAILGPSGSGKSTVMDILAFLLDPDAFDTCLFTPTPDISYAIHDLWQAKAHDALAAIRLQHLGVILQSGALLPFLSVYDNMDLARQAQTLSAPFAGRCPSGGDSAVEPYLAIESLAEQLHIQHLLHAMPHTLSLGERQRVAIGRTLAARPSIILADEPTAALDPLYAQRVMELLTQAVDATKTTLIFVTHDTHLAQKNATRLLHVKLEQDTAPNAQGVIATLYEDDPTGNMATGHNSQIDNLQKENLQGENTHG